MSRWTAPWRCTRPGSRSSPARPTSRWPTASASRRPGTCAGCSRCSLIRTCWRRCGRTRSASPRCRPGSASTRAYGRNGLWPRSRSAAGPRRSSNPQAQLSGAVTAEELLAAPFVADPLRAHDCAPVTDGAAVVIIAAADRARELCERPAWITGFEHRIDSGQLGARDLTSSPSAASAAARRPARPGSRWLSCTRPFTHQELVLDWRPGAARGDPDQPVRRRAGREPDVRGRAGPHRACRPADHRPARPAARSATRPAARPCSRTWCA